jgi:hypothetical protein
VLVDVAVTLASIPTNPEFFALVLEVASVVVPSEQEALVISKFKQCPYAYV